MKTLHRINEERFSNEYLSLVTKIWSSELYAFNKTVAHNSFADPILIPTLDILEWTQQEIKDINRTKKN